MYPYTLFWEITLYDLIMATGVAVAFLVFVLYAKKLRLPEKLRSAVLVSALVAVAFGLVFSTLVQSIYFYIETGKFEWRGMTFYGGLLGGAVSFLGMYFLTGYLLYRNTETPKEYLHSAMKVFGIVITTVAIAHAIGRVGCLVAGCCHGKVYEDKRWYTLPIHHISANNVLLYTEYAVPVPLFEMLFLLGLFALLSWRVLSGKEDALPLYMILYGAWRFFIEFFRADDRGETLLKFLSPSQLTAVLMIAGGIVLYVVYEKVIRKKAASD